MFVAHLVATIIHGKNFMAIFTTLSGVISFSTCDNIRHTEHGKNSHTIDFHTVL